MNRSASPGGLRPGIPAGALIAATVALLAILGWITVQAGNGAAGGWSVLPEWPSRRLLLSQDTADHLARVTVRAKGAGKPYDRSAFGSPWSDEDHNGCDTRNDILSRDMADVSFGDRSSCRVRQGTLADPYTGRTIEFVAGKESRKVQIDHVVALSDSWVSGGMGVAGRETPCLRQRPGESAGRGWADE
ncbi:hypothetical protein [Rothia koreensis]|uniref:hypothetical protein n=1 Tax=Rothia koreensis TaxID=592378 RepID=UPI003FCCE2F9